NVIVTFVFAMKSLPEIKIRLSNFKISSLKEMSGFGLQMQVSKLSSFASDKYDELLLGIFSVLNNVTLFNIGNRIVRFGKFLPLQIITQVAPIAAEFNSKHETDKLKDLFVDTTKYLVAITSPVFIFIFAFSDLIINTWMGPGYETAALIIKILIAGQLINIALSAPGNSITPNIGLPKFQMYEGLIHLTINITLTYFLIRYYGVIGAAYGNACATLISSAYVFIVSVKYFGKDFMDLFSKILIYPILLSLIIVSMSYLIYYFAILNYGLIIVDNRMKGILVLLVLIVLSLTVYSFLIYKSRYLNERDKNMLNKFIIKIFPFYKFN
ncbi:MAG: oligosaccharide flippase family protein, partial [bacterium]